MASRSLPPRSSPPRSAKSVARLALDGFLQSEVPIPRTLSIAGKVVAISDVAWAIDAFRVQRAVLKDLGGMWPAAHLAARPGPTRYEWVPIDLREPTPSPYEEPSLFKEVASGRAQALARDRVARSGLAVEDRPIKEVELSFTENLSTIIKDRSTNDSVNQHDGPPTAEFEVTTESHGIEVIYAIGFFISTAQGFGFSTPARRRLPWGTYIFGSVGQGGQQFQKTLWTVPDDTHTHLNV